MEKLKHICGEIKTVNTEDKNLSLGKHIFKGKCMPCEKNNELRKNSLLSIFKDHKQLKG